MITSNRSIAELADRKAELLEELGEVNAEIKARAGERDEFDADETAESAEVEAATDKSAENVENTSATT
nr:hypothetical protein [Mycolicibacterium komanii]CRL70324.1 hypothetical protein CPGR_01938 [Mycolicibacterium komanii]